MDASGETVDVSFPICDTIPSATARRDQVTIILVDNNYDEDLFFDG